MWVSVRELPGVLWCLHVSLLLLPLRAVLTWADILFFLPPSPAPPPLSSFPSQPRFPFPSPGSSPAEVEGRKHLPYHPLGSMSGLTNPIHTDRVRREETLVITDICWEFAHKTMRPLPGPIPVTEVYVPSEATQRKRRLGGFWAEEASK